MGVLKILIDGADYVFTWFMAGLLLDVLYQLTIAVILNNMDWYTTIWTFRPNFDKVRLLYKLASQAWWWLFP
jgi:hypothetical protein